MRNHETVRTRQRLKGLRRARACIHWETGTQERERESRTKANQQTKFFLKKNYTTAHTWYGGEETKGIRRRAGKKKESWRMNQRGTSRRVLRSFPPLHHEGTGCLRFSYLAATWRRSYILCDILWYLGRPSGSCGDPVAHVFREPREMGKEEWVEGGMRDGHGEESRYLTYGNAGRVVGGHPGGVLFWGLGGGDIEG